MISIDFNLVRSRSIVIYKVINNYSDNGVDIKSKKLELKNGK